jgi:Ras-related GTP-binding protein C/D
MQRYTSGYDTPTGSFAPTAAFPTADDSSMHAAAERRPAAPRNEEDRSQHTLQDTRRLPRILLMGLRRSGKTSIFKVVFHKMSPHETLYLESTAKTVRHHVQNSCVVDLNVWDFTGSGDVDDMDHVSTFEPAGALLFVIDAQDDYAGAITRVVATIDRAFRVNRGLFFEIFIHKVDGVPEDRKLELQRDISHQVSSRLSDRGMEEANIAFYLSSIYDHSVYENVSKVVQKLIPQLGMLENLLDILLSNCRMEKVGY